MKLKKVKILGILLVVLMLLTACSSSEVPEKQLQEDLENSTVYTELNVSTTEFSVIKRQTDEEAKTDLVYVTIKGENDTYSVVRNYLMTYGLYNDGWVLDGIESYQDDQHFDQTVPLSKNQAEEDLLIEAGYEIVANEVYEQEGTYYNKITYNVSNEFAYMDEIIQVSDYYYFDTIIYDWEYLDFESSILEQNWKLNGTWHFETDNPDKYNLGHSQLDSIYMDFVVNSFDGHKVDLTYNQSIVFDYVNGFLGHVNQEQKASGSGIFDVTDTEEYGLYLCFNDGNTKIELIFDRDEGVISGRYGRGVLVHTEAK